MQNEVLHFSLQTKSNFQNKSNKAYKDGCRNAFLREEGGTRSVTEGARETWIYDKSFAFRTLLQSPIGDSSLPEGAFLPIRFIYKYY